MSALLQAPTQTQLTEDVAEIYQTRYMGLVSFTILIWDHMVTFPAEVEYVWKGKKGPLVYLFFINRYLTPLGFIVNLVAYNLEYWPDNICEHYVRYEGVMTNFGVEVVGLMMLIRVRALYYDKSRLIIGFVAFILVAETATNVYLLIHAIPVPHQKYQDQVHSCSMIYNAGAAGAVASAWIPLFYDTVVMLLTMYITVPTIRRSAKGFIVWTIFRDGLLYYAVICIVTLVLTIMIAAAPPGLRNITAQLELLLTVTMMSRITIHLKKKSHAPSYRHYEGEINVSFSRDRSYSDVMGRKRSSSYSSASVGHADLGISFARPPPVHNMSTIWSEQNSGIQTPATGLGPIPTLADIDELVSARVSEQQDVRGIARTRRDEESF